MPKTNTITLHEALRGRDVQIELHESDEGNVVTLSLHSETDEIYVVGLHETANGLALVRYDASGADWTGMDEDGNIPLIDDAKNRIES